MHRKAVYPVASLLSLPPSHFSSFIAPSLSPQSLLTMYASSALLHSLMCHKHIGPEQTFRLVTHAHTHSVPLSDFFPIICHSFCNSCIFLSVPIPFSPPLSLCSDCLPCLSPYPPPLTPSPGPCQLCEQRGSPLALACAVGMNNREQG